MSLSERMDVVRRFGKAITENRESIAALITDEMGCPITQTVASQSGAAIALIDTNLELVEQYPWRTVRRSNTGNALVTRVPIGVVAAVVPWNAPLSVAMLKLVPALLSGCTVILKPSPEAPLSSYLLAEMVQAAGFPAGVMNIVTADRAESEYLVTHPGVNKVSFTGSTLAGRRIASLCGTTSGATHSNWAGSPPRSSSTTPTSMVRCSPSGRSRSVTTVRHARTRRGSSCRGVARRT